MNPENLNFPKKILSDVQRTKISKVLAEKQSGVSMSVWHRMFQLSVTLIFLIGIGLFASYFINQDAGGRSANEGMPYKIKLPDNVTLENAGRNEMVFKQGDRVVGGIMPSSIEEKETLESGPGIFEKREVTELKYPAVRILEHVKTMTATQTYHYFVEVDEKTMVRVYFHTPYVTEEPAAAAMRTFEVH